METIEIVVIITLITVLLIIINTYLIMRLITHFKGQKVNIKSLYIIKGSETSGSFKAEFYNKSVSDVKLCDFGFIYKKKYISLFDITVEKLDKEDKTKILLEKDEHASYTISYDFIKERLLSIFDNRKKLTKIIIYAKSINGVESRKKSRYFYKNVKVVFKNELLIEKIEQKRLDLEKSTAEKEIKRKKALEIKTKKAELRSKKWTAFKDNIKRKWNGIFKKKDIVKKEIEAEKKESK